MARRRRNEPEPEPEADVVGDSESLKPLPEMIRRAAALGLSGFFMTEGALRKAFGDTVPQEWVDFAVGQAERTRDEMIERLGDEMSRMIQKVDIGQVIEQLISGHTIEINARVRLLEREEGADDERPATTRLDVRIGSR